MKRDTENPMYDHTLDTLCSEAGYEFQREKYGPKLAFMRKYFGERFASISVLDVGVGYGVFLKIAGEDYGLRNLSGMDPYPNSIEIAKTMTKARIELGSLFDMKWPFEEHSFDVITCFDVLEHLEKPDEFFVNAGRYLRGGGIVLISTPNKSLPYRMRSIPFIGFPDTNPTHINVQPPAYWRRAAARNGYEVVASWKGEYLTHIRLIPKLLKVLCAAIRIDARKVPLVSAFEQAFVMVARPARQQAHG
ncbi:MAG: class I SAM-dependent methyltransferase [Candidatus Krumholzibacteria bacterium]|nr:class I SAM-dependent methyltransferase [Candidatus Krumholzibacteria bacterium]